MLCPSGYRPSRNIFGSSFKLFNKIFCTITLTSSQNSFILGHNHRQWNSVPFSPHLVHMSGILALHLFRFSGVIYTLISQLYCRSFRRVLPVCVWAALQAVLHCSNVRSSCKSVFQALSLEFEDSGENASRRS